MDLLWAALKPHYFQSLLLGVFFFSFCLTNLAAQRRNKLTHVGERGFARGGGGEGRAGWRRQLGRAIAVRHADYGVGVAAARFTSITVWQAWAIASEKKEGKFSELQTIWHQSTRINKETWRAKTYSKPFFGKVFLSVCKLFKKHNVKNVHVKREYMFIWNTFSERQTFITFIYVKFYIEYSSRKKWHTP